MVEAPVALGIGTQIRCALIDLHFSDDGTQLRDPSVVDSFGGLSYRKGFQDGTGLEDLIGFFGRNEADASSLIPLVHDKTFLLQKRQSCANCRSFCLESIGKVLFDETFVRLKEPVEDRLAETSRRFSERPIFLRVRKD